VSTSELRVGVVGAGLIGADHIARLTNTTAGAVVSAVIEPEGKRAPLRLPLSRPAPHLPAR
jgi:myo-inositol 2-dehydrogenase / D-chiro-inositol 1-dehydrogenase